MEIYKYFFSLEYYHHHGRAKNTRRFACVFSQLKIIFYVKLKLT